MGGADWDMPPSNCLPTSSPSRATHLHRGPTAAPTGRPMREFILYLPPHIPPTVRRGRRRAPPHPTTTAHTVRILPSVPDSPPFPSLNVP